MSKQAPAAGIRQGPPGSRFPFLPLREFRGPPPHTHLPSLPPPDLYPSARSQTAAAVASRQFRAKQPSQEFPEERLLRRGSRGPGKFEESDESPVFMLRGADGDGGQEFVIV